MAGSIEVVRRIADAPDMAARKRFRGYKGEAEKAIRKGEVEDDEALRRMMWHWKTWQYNHEKVSPSYYHSYLRSAEDLRCSADDVERFVLALEEFRHGLMFGEKAGYFVSALINGGEETDYVIHTKHLDFLLNHLGFMNRKNVIVNGDVGSHLGDDMTGGSITVNGDAGDWIGSGIRGGKISVKGNAGRFVGHVIVNGDIELEGDYMSLAHQRAGGRIYHKGKLIAGE
jgi:hypothetical protein